MKILIINCGLLRTFQDVFENQYKNLYLPNSNHFINTILVTEPLPLTRKEATLEIVEETYKKLENFTTIINQPKPSIKRGYESFKEQFVKFEQGINSIEDFPTYDQVVRIRPDLIFETPVNIEYFNGLQGIAGWNLTGSHQLMHDVMFCGRPDYMRTITEFKKGWLYKVQKSGHFYFNKNLGKEAEVQLLLHAGYSDINVRCLRTGVFVVQNKSDMDDLIAKKKNYYKLRTDLPLAHCKHAIRKIV